jgi:cytochrome c peroxidase
VSRLLQRSRLLQPGRLLAVWLCAAVFGCGGDSSGPDGGGGPAPSVASANGAVAATVGTPFSYDATKGGTTFTPAGAASGLSYSISFGGSANGLSAAGGTVSGQAEAPGVVWATIVATDSMGRTASDRFAVAVFAAGLPTPTLPATPYGYSDASAPLPEHFLTAVGGESVVAHDNTPTENPITDAGAALGRVLFYDPRLSANDGLSCAGCHNEALGFSDTPARSAGFAGALTRRHSPGLANARFYGRGRFFWDERAPTLEAQALMPIQDAGEMGLSLDDLSAKLAATPYYPPLFAAAFGTPEVTSDRVSRAVAQFVRSLVSGASRYDQGVAAGGAPGFGGVLTAQEVEGEALFRSTGCAACHATVAQVSDSIHNIGLDAVSPDTGAGHGAFKAPSLRNVAVRPRFMHDGRFTSLEQVIDFFDAGVQPNPDLDPRLKTADGSPKRLNLTANQKAALTAFLRTLTDSTFLTSPRFANPFAPPSGPPPEAGVTMQATAFHPAELTVKPGTVVTWTNLDGILHTASFVSPLIGTTPAFATGTRQLTMPSTPGTYPYICSIHGASMSGTIIVQ